MSDEIIAIIIPLVAIAIIFAWVPLLNRISPPNGRSLERRRSEKPLIVQSSVGSIRD
jgi:hypothetical protein